MDNEILNIEAAEPKGTPEGEAAFRVFSTQEDFQRCIDKALGKRLLKAREQEEELCVLKEKVTALCSEFGCQSIDEIKNTVSEVNLPSADEIAAELSRISQNENSTERAESLLCDERFKNLIKSGLSLKDALTSLMLSEIIESEKQGARDSLLREIRTKSMRPSEDALSGYGSFSATLDPRNLSVEQRNEIKERVRRGERVTF